MKKLLIEVSSEDRELAEKALTYLNLALRRLGAAPVVVDQVVNSRVMKLAMDDYTLAKSILDATTGDQPTTEIEMVLK